MGLFKRLSGLLGFPRHEEHHHHHGTPASEAAVPPSSSGPPPAFASAQNLPRRGFGVPVQVPVDRGPPPPLLVFCPDDDGGVQGLRWYARRLKIDEDGDIANEFLDEVSPDGMEVQHEKPLSRFKVKFSTRPAEVKNLYLLPNGKIHHLVDYQGRLEWV